MCQNSDYLCFMNKIQLTLLILFGTLLSGAGQPIQCYLPFKAECPGQVILPIEVENFTDVASISLSFSYDTLALQYISAQNLHPSLTTGIHVINAIHGKLIFSWFSLTPATIGSGTFIELLFQTRAAKSSVLSWDTLQAGTCIFTDITGTEYPSRFHDGFLTNMLQIPGLIYPVHQSSGLPTNLDFSWTVSECDGRFEFQLSDTGNFAHIEQQQHNLSNPSASVSGLEFNKIYYWRVRSGNSIDTTPWSAVRQFQTKGPDAVDDPENTAPFRVIALEHTLSGQLSLQIEITGATPLSICLHDLSGKILYAKDWSTFSGGIYRLEIPIPCFSRGMYCLNFSFVEGDKPQHSGKKFTILK